jgi:nucleotide-binding universal stress UspA family protein
VIKKNRWSGKISGEIIKLYGRRFMKVLIAVDGSECSSAALEEACRLFENSPNAQFKIITVYDLMLPPTQPFAVSAELIQKVDEESHKQANEIAKRAVEQIREKCPELAARTTTKVVCGSAARAIVEAAEKDRANLIIVGSHGYGFWKRTWIGSVSNAVVNHAPCSVLIARGKHI